MVACLVCRVIVIWGIIVDKSCQFGLEISLAYKLINGGHLDAFLSDADFAHVRCSDFCLVVGEMNLYYTDYCHISSGEPGGHSHWKVVWGPPFSGHVLALETHHFKPLSSSRAPPPIFLKNVVFSSPVFADFWLHFSSWDSFSKKVVAETPVSNKKSVPETILLKIWAAQAYPKKFLSTLPPLWGGG